MLIPCEYKVVVDINPIEEVTAGGIHLTADTVERERLAETDGEIVSIGPMAFDDWPNIRRPKIGDKVIIAKYAGQIVKDDEKEYRLINDKDILAIRGE